MVSCLLYEKWLFVSILFHSILMVLLFRSDSGPEILERRTFLFKIYDLSRNQLR
jgi:hypothetical protein